MGKFIGDFDRGAEELDEFLLIKKRFLAQLINGNRVTGNPPIKGVTRKKEIEGNGLAVFCPLHLKSGGVRGGEGGKMAEACPWVGETQKIFIPGDEIKTVGCKNNTVGTPVGDGESGGGAGEEPLLQFYGPNYYRQY